MGEETIEITKDLTIPQLFYQQCKRYGSGKVAMREKERIFSTFDKKNIDKALVFIYMKKHSKTRYLIHETGNSGHYRNYQREIAPP